VSGSSGRRHYGLGLALVAEIARAHGGRVSARNCEPDVGAAITLELPALDE
jgi:signal transduction histidine kinase